MWPGQPWADYDPANRAFEPERARTALLDIVRARVRGRRRDGTSQEMHDAIVAALGAWAGGWRWTVGDGGPSAGWCCDRHSVLRDGEAGPEPTVERALAGLASWRGFLVELDRRFAALRIATAPLDVYDELERVAGQLLPWILERTHAEDAWYQTFHTVMWWYLDAAGIATQESQHELEAVVTTRFTSWVAPPPETFRETCTELALHVAPRVVADVPRDALADWLRARDRLPVLTPGAVETSPADAHAAYIETVDRVRDPERAERMAAALLLCRDSARRGLAIAADQLAEWQGAVLGLAGPAMLRTTDAFGKRGRERYGCPPDLYAQLERTLGEAEQDDLPIAVRAARVYLDVCFLHPFVDGNARAARLALDHVLARAGLGLLVAEPVFALSRGAADPDVLQSLATVVARALAPLA